MVSLRAESHNRLLGFKVPYLVFFSQQDLTMGGFSLLCGHCTAHLDLAPSLISIGTLDYFELTLCMEVTSWYLRKRNIP